MSGWLGSVEIKRELLLSLRILHGAKCAATPREYKKVASWSSPLCYQDIARMPASLSVLRDHNTAYAHEYMLQADGSIKCISHP